MVPGGGVLKGGVGVEEGEARGTPPVEGGDVAIAGGAKVDDSGCDDLGGRVGSEVGCADEREGAGEDGVGGGGAGPAEGEGIPQVSDGLGNPTPHPQKFGHTQGVLKAETDSRSGIRNS